MNAEGSIIRVGHSPDPDDAFMFHALTRGVIDTSGRTYEHVLLDIQTLNDHALTGTYEISAVSIHSYPRISDRYALMNCGASMGEGYGPMLIGNRELSLSEVGDLIIAIPGMGTSAYLALRLALGDVNVQVIPFDEILPRVKSGEFELGLIIHEGQLTWQDEGVFQILNLGVWWRDETGLPLPLGGNVIRRDLGTKMCRDLTEDVKNSIIHALDNPTEALEFAKLWGRGIDDETNQSFVKMYVNKRTIDFGEDGRAAVRLFLSEGKRIGLVDPNFDIEGIEFIGCDE